ncbi:hypothetical protein MPAR168_15370 [Methylorubrum populi]|uniref:Uncharacterized protein n=1 Tax=Methylobacterium radiotolerans TaxID=31998 RepID=A0ABU7T842_9HYPH
MRVGRIISTTTAASSIEDGTELRTEQSLPSEWHDGDMVVVRFSAGGEVTFYADPEQSADAFDYARHPGHTWGVRLERLPPDERGHAGLRVQLENHHKDILRLDREAGR